MVKGLKENQILVVIKKPGEEPYVEPLFDNTLESFQEAVGGYIETVTFASDACLICNEEGKITGMPLNRAIRMDGQIVDVIAGPCFVCDCSKDNFGSLSPEQQRRYMRQFKYPEHIIKINGEIAAIPYNPSPKSKER